MRLLIVEDEKELCDTISKSLYESGYVVDTCYDGYEALDYILTEDYDLIVLGKAIKLCLECVGIG